MKKSLLLFAVLTIATHAFSISDKVKLGLFAAPGASWMKPMGKDIDKGIAGFGMTYGLKVEYYFKDQNYALSTGLYGGMDMGGVRGRDTFKVLSGKSVLERYNTNYIMLPLYLKLKTNAFKDKYILFGELGGSFVFNVSARANYSDGIAQAGTVPPSIVSVSKENVLQNGNEVQKLIPDFRYQIFDFRLSVGGGMEYVINDKTSVFFAVHYHNGFVNQIRDTSVNPKKDAIVVRNVLLSIGAMF